ncbi:MAG: hydroxyphenylacetyl-CoA thioesterase PaaI [Geminicoccaceae bacterium]
MADPQPAQGADAQSVAEAVRTGMYERDRAAQALGIVVEAIGPGTARCRMTVRDDMAQGHGTCHGGLTFTLADTAFAYACNAYNRATVALAAEIAFLAPARAGQVLCATARERSRAGRTGIYDVEVTNGEGTLVALFRGTAYETRGEVVAPARARE